MLVETLRSSRRILFIAAALALAAASAAHAADPATDLDAWQAAKLMGTVPSVVFGGTMTLLTVALIAWKFPALRRLKGLGRA